MILTRTSSSSSTKPFISITPVVLLVCFLACQSISSRAAAGVVINIQESGGNVVATGSGTLDLSALTQETPAESPGFIIPAAAAVLVGPIEIVYEYAIVTGPRNWGPPGIGANASAATGEQFGVGGNNAIIAVPAGYVSGTPLSGTATWEGQTFASLGVNPGTYNYTWGTGTSADFLTVIVGQSVPEPTSIMLAVTGSVFIFAYGRSAGRKKQRVQCLEVPHQSSD
jgi:hypothetical protein